jgi:hypothetical protein
MPRQASDPRDVGARIRHRVATDGGRQEWHFDDALDAVESRVSKRGSRTSHRVSIGRMRQDRHFEDARKVVSAWYRTRNRTSRLNDGV